MKAFMGADFLLDNEIAVKLYREHAEGMPIIDYHCHLSPKEIYENKTFATITEAWLYGDHYKWRIMRANGVEERCFTGNASDEEKFTAWAKTVPMAIGNPLYSWTHLELQRFFGIHDVLNEKTAPFIWKKTNDLLQEEGFAEWVQALEDAAGISITSYKTFLEALESRVRFFHAGRVSDHALDQMVYAETTEDEAAGIFAAGLSGRCVPFEDEKKFKTWTLQFLCGLYAELDWAMQFHINALRNTNTRMLITLGPDTGYDSINDEHIAKPLAQLLNSAAMKQQLPKTILYSLNPNDNYIIASMMNSFQDGKTPGKIQFGTAWWFNDTKDGMLQQMKALSNSGLFSRFIGMLTDSRSFLSYTRHVPIRRIVCSLIGTWAENGEAPYDMELLGGIVEGICYRNAQEYFRF
ncbi:glucuronate isomerase [Bacillus nakamurai]|uniref:Uronate isomerase n=1 Tax=Bacillus nakamurai TaxID=1793963 RepID=A0A150F2W0_9BACI|nr:glucuronate isomerase [Bacillus nakamurai]KXZ13445.1 glucuronate isomerase [Bacillus nakamurai]MED1227107.1 glucuronate isomerase [Bacillus nakamurai]